MDTLAPLHKSVLQGLSKFLCGKAHDMTKTTQNQDSTPSKTILNIQVGAEIFPQEWQGLVVGWPDPAAGGALCRVLGPAE
jgi:hypothetical protein